jgi:hypothetical protein
MMAAAKTSEKKIKGHTGKAYYIAKTAPILALAYELEIVDGIVIGKKQISRAEDLPATAVGIASKELWKQYQNAESTKNGSD